MKKTLWAVALLGLFSCWSAPSSAATYDEEAQVHIMETVTKWANNQVIIDAIKEQNIEHADLNIADIISMDRKWRSEVSLAESPFVDKVLNKDISAYLKKIVADSNGLYLEAFVMDNKGMIVGASSDTSDFWQGDEDKFRNSFGSGANAVFVDEVKYDSSSDGYSSQASLTIKDPETKQPIGALTIGMDVSKLHSSLK